jgi:hypothetical protein
MAASPERVHCHHPAVTHRTRTGFEAAGRGNKATVFFFFSNRLGCLGSLLVSALVTLVLLRLFHVL